MCSGVVVVHECIGACQTRVSTRECRFIDARRLDDAVDSMGGEGQAIRIL
jgi:hypothetical protein